MAFVKVKLSPEVKRKPGRPSRKDQDQAELLLKLRNLVDKQDELIAQANDEVTDLRQSVEFYRKQVNHLIALLNILTKGA